MQDSLELPSAEDPDAISPGENDCSLDEVFAQLYNKIRLLAARLRWNGANPTLNPTALAHEAYIKLRSHPPELSAKSYDEVIRIFAHAMHQILVDAARRKHAQKRVVSERPESPELPIEGVLMVTAALEELETENSRQAQVVRCRFILGMTVSETALALNLTKRTVEREWHEAKARLGEKIDPSGA